MFAQILYLRTFDNLKIVAGIYFHIPFCRQQCGYCDFYRTTKLSLMGAVVEQMHAELEGTTDFLHDSSVETIYFGGGTPSLLHPSEIERFIEHVRTLYDVADNAEITVEANPDDVTEDYVAALGATSVNRISMGVQSLDDACLRMMGRRHTARQAVEAVERLQRAGYDNISLDLIFGVDGFGGDSLRRTVDGLVALAVPHISAYHLTIEEGSRFGRLVAAGKMRQVDEQTSEEEFLAVHRMLTAADYEHYEVSNYARAGQRSRHNSSYWRGCEYLGIGAGAHSFNGSMRRWSEQPIEEYATAICYESEQLSAKERMNEYVMVGLRRIEGISLDSVECEFGASASQRIALLAEPFVRSGDLVEYVVDGSRRLAIPAERFMVSDYIISTLFEG